MNCEDCGKTLTEKEIAEVNATAQFLTPTVKCTQCQNRYRYWYGDSESDNGPTGHGDICMSDADPGL